ncbi:amidohydrolase family protein [Micromonospora echinofusca]|uniref:Amidohydrolase family protein n=1 Tax=Micromonospora echinofusca TaxID=47858 RepID=A0ABS3VV86_MICEH|nr:amidohydrolase family protein [Micromonospora echinofusca]MBO4208426.1 amidohydrolase family protein [Micromonospora echinofusca]
MTDAVPFIDTHVHFWDLAHPELTYGWLQPGVAHPILGDIEGIKSPRFDATHLWAEARFAGVEAFVHVQAAVGTPDPVVETRWLTEMAARYGHPAAIVAHADLAGADVEQVLDRHGESALLRGVRDFAVEPALAADADQRLDPGLRALTRRGLLLDLDCEWPHMPAAAQLARRHPDLVVVLEHLGYPRRRDPEYFRGWRRGIDALAAVPNVHCKISGVGMGDPRWSSESIAPWIGYCIEVFGPQRCVFGTNWPVDRLFSSYDAIVTAYRDAVAGLSDAEQRQVLHDNAVALYRL